MTARRIDLPRLVREAGFAPGQPVSVAATSPEGRLACVAGGWPSGAGVTRADRFYAASLSKQVTGAAVAVLVRDGALDPDDEIPATFLPKWALRPSVRQVLHHVAGLPGAAEIDVEAGVDWTNDVALRLLADCDPAAEPGKAYVYSNLGYVLLARQVERAAGMPFQDFAATRLFGPLGLVGIGFADDAMPNWPHGDLLGASRPLTTGDGGLWTTAEAFAGWLDAQNRDSLGIGSLVEQDYPLPDGGGAGYGWGIGLRMFRGHRLFSHGGGWTGARAKAVRCPARALSVAVLAVDDRDAPVSVLVDTVLDALAA